MRGGRQSDAAIHRVSRNADGVVCSGNEGQWIATGFHPRDYKKWGQGTVRAFFSLFTLHSSLIPSLAFLETDTEAYVAVAVTGGG